MRKFLGMKREIQWWLFPLTFILFWMCAFNRFTQLEIAGLIIILLLTLNYAHSGK